jgi:membrane-bound ClpP family serine protease
MKSLSLLCTIALLVALFNLPIGYYTFLRVIVTIGAITIILNETKNDVNLLGIAFIVTAIIFNPLIPIYLYKKYVWMPIDVFTAGLFLVYALKNKK